MRKALNIIFGCIFILTSAFSASGQQAVSINGWQSSFDTTAVYSAQAPIFIYNQYPKVQPIQLRSYCPVSDTTKVTYVWSQYDTVSYAFDIPIKTDSDKYFSQVETLSPGCYQVKVYNADTLVGSASAWAFLNNDSISTNKDATDNLQLAYKHCYFIELETVVLLKNFTYRNPADSLHRKYILKNSIKCSWTFNPELKVTPAITTGTNLQYTTFIENILRIGDGNGKPPAVPTHMYLQAKDKFNLIRNDSIYFNYPIYTTWAHFNMNAVSIHDGFPSGTT